MLRSNANSRLSKFFTLLCVLTFSVGFANEDVKFTLEYLVDQVVQGNDPHVDKVHTDLKDSEHIIPSISQRALDDVSGYLKNERYLDVDFSITNENYRDYLNAAKYIDLSVAEPTVNTTYNIRLECLLKSKGQLKTLEAFSYRLNSSFFDDYDENGQFLPNKKYELYHAGQFELSFMPEWSNIQKKITHCVIDTVLGFSDQLGYENPHLILFTGTYGSGKSYQVQHHRLTKNIQFDPDALFNGVLGTDAVKRVYMSLVPGSTNAQVHHEGVAIRLQIMKSLFSYFPKSSIIQEAVLSTEATIQDQFTLAKDNNFAIKIVDLDADLETACMRILTRDPSKGDSIPHFRATVAAQKSIRNNRILLHQKVLENDGVEEYELVVSMNGQTYLVAEKKDGALFILPQYENLFLEAMTPTSAIEVENVAQKVITNEDCQIYGERIEPFVGMTIEDALLQLSKS